MARLEPEDLNDPVKIYAASTLGLARAVEALLDTSGVDYAVEVEPLGRTTLFGSHRYAAVFYVTGEQAPPSRTLLKQGDLARGIVEDDDG